MAGKTNIRDFRNSFTLRCALSLISFVLFALPVFGQDDDAVTGKVLDGISRKQIGKAEIITASNDFGFYVKMWLDGGSKLRIIRPGSGSRSTTLNCSFREYKVDANDPKNETLWDEVASGTATLQTPVSPSGEVRNMPGSMVVTERVVGDKDVKVTEKSQRFEIIIE